MKVLVWNAYSSFFQLICPVRPRGTALNETHDFVQPRHMIFKLRHSSEAGNFKVNSPNPASARTSDHEFGYAETGCVIAGAPDICLFAGRDFDVCQRSLIVISDAVPAESISTHPVSGSTKSSVWRVEPWETDASFIFPLLVF